MVILLTGRERLLCMSQLLFGSMVPTVKSHNIDGAAILECYDTEDFSDLFPLVETKKRDKCYLALIAYGKENRKKKTKK